MKNPQYEQQQRQLQNLSLALQEKEMETMGLKQALKVLQYTMKQKTSLYPDLTNQLKESQEELTATQLQLEQQTEHAIGLQYQVLRQQEEIRNLKEKQKQLVRRVVELEIDLETHDVHFSQAAEQLKKLEQDAIQQVFQNENHPHNSKEEPKSFNLIAKLTSDLTQVESRYKRDAAASLQKHQQLEQHNQTLMASVAVLEERLNDRNKSAVKFTLDENHNTNIYRRRINELETTNTRLLRENEELKQRWERIESSALMLAATNESIHGISNSMEDKRLSKDDELSMSSLQEALYRMQRQMAMLRMQAIQYQVRNFETPYTENSNSSLPAKDRWRLSKSLCSSSDDGSYTGSSSDDSEIPSIEGFQTTIQDLKELLVRKDRELELQRTEFQTKERELLAQLQETRASLNDAQYNQLPRFFM
ncbi:hypothetical protein IV203_002003 [Nitzschia inconspicua]|uniref:Uncharacterized protein n=1 Tax=Nitzschia inconspicua TaxID=303405 RepID=A0A9K3L9A2_9STRA|nr:hypothetical protein IV203_002003 [Nitzschia inconspicua]